ncbi:hypothetical protein QCA50_009135 [Cerrena zonata]|uniref:Uncharacterized protein n=1 Tax=Cerrena zonata TaxID=2478898 RepID=A0AAW0GEA9_9APHY
MNASTSKTYMSYMTAAPTITLAFPRDADPIPVLTLLKMDLRSYLQRSSSSYSQQHMDPSSHDANADRRMIGRWVYTVFYSQPCTSQFKFEPILRIA